MPKCNEGIHKEHRNPQADALRRPLDNAHTKSMKSPQLRRRNLRQCTNFKNSVVLAEQCVELNNINCVLSYTSRTGPPFSNNSNYSRIAVSCSCWFASKRYVPMARKIKSAAASRLVAGPFGQRHSNQHVRDAGAASTSFTVGWLLSAASRGHFPCAGKCAPAFWHKLTA